MRDFRLQSRLAALAALKRRGQFLESLTIGWASSAAIGLLLFLFRGSFNASVRHWLWLLPVLFGIGFALCALKRSRREDDFAWMLRELEPNRADVRHLFSTALEQKATESSGSLGFLQLRVVEEALAHSAPVGWRERLRQRVNYAKGLNVCTLLVFSGVLLLLHHGFNGGSGAGAAFGEEVTVTPGDTQVERGTGLVIAARFGGTPPADAVLVLNSADGHQSRLPMARRLADPVFGTAIPEVTGPGTYRVEYGGRKTRDYKISIFEFPALVRADADLRYPAYTGLTNRTIRDTLRVSAVQGSRLTYTLQLNKPVARAQLVGQEQSLALETKSNALAVLSDYCLTNNARFSLQLVDADGRANKFPTEFVFQALTNQRPEIKLVFPTGDPRVSRLQELQLQAQASDDFGLLKYGIGFGVAGQEPRFIELGQAVPANVKRQFDYLLSLEKLGVEVDQAVAYFAWAEDYGPDGTPRRTFGDVFFAEVRPFEEIFRADQAGGAEGEQQGGQGGGNERARLAELQKQIVVATWNLQREKVAVGGGSKP